MKNAIGFYILASGMVALFSCTSQTDYDPAIGLGKYTNEEYGKSIDVGLGKKGEEIYMEKCATCHYLSTEDRSGPGWEDITAKRSATWLMNFLTNTDDMSKVDPELQKQIKKYKMTMPELGLTEKEARSLLEFMRMNDRGMVSRERELPDQCMHTGPRKRKN